MKLEYFTIMRGEQKPDVYGGEECNEHIPRWEAYAEGDMDSDMTEELTLMAKNFMPGTRITVEEPCCPKCGMNATLCSETNDCDYDWKEWADNEYS